MVCTTEKKVFEELVKREISFLSILHVYVVVQFYPWFKGDFLLFLGQLPKIFYSNLEMNFSLIQSYLHNFLKELPYLDLVIKL